MDQRQPFDFKDLKDFKPPKINFKAMFSIVIAIIDVSFIFSLWFTVDPDSRARTEF